MNAIKEFFRIVFQLALSLPFAFTSVIALVPFFASLKEQIGDRAAIYSYGAAAFIAIIVFVAPTIRRCLGRGFIMVAVSLFLLQVTTTFVTIEVSSQQIAEANETDEIEVAATYVGTGIVATGATLVTGFFGFFFGSVCLILGVVLLLGARREVVSVDNVGKRVSDEGAYKKHVTSAPKKPFVDARGRREPTLSATPRDED